jgi:hypothetical protein
MTDRIRLALDLRDQTRAACRACLEAIARGAPDGELARLFDALNSCHRAFRAIYDRLEGADRDEYRMRAHGRARAKSVN